ncbi:MAG: cbb3-type cytochrome c oxidase subunit I, partial [Bdellovibrionota bacterium]
MAHGHVEGTNYLNAEKGLWSWLTTLDHKRIGIMYFITVMLLFFIGGMFALLLRLELMMPGTQFISPDVYNQVMTLHGSVMV